MNLTEKGLEGVYLGHWTCEDAGTGCTAIVVPAGARGGVDVRGGAPATRETDLLRPEETVDVVHCVILSGGSAFGIESMSGAATELERRGLGLDVGVGKVPIVTGACLFDLVCGDPTVRPGLSAGAAAVTDALDGTDNAGAGNVGAGTGCTVGKLCGPAQAMKSGLGTCVEHVGGLTVMAVAAVNACGDVVDPTDGHVIAGLRVAADSAEMSSSEEALLGMAATMPLDAAARTNTTISCVVTNARLTKAGCTKVAQMAADGYAHAIRPTHTTNDGDSIFVLATGEVDYPIDVVGVAATRAIERAIANGAATAKGAHGYPGAADGR